ncbi:MAG: YdbL family protein [Parvularculaceae bacterium]|nr:YdbL family protein [Parvularculaceae bacterium]
MFKQLASAAIAATLIIGAAQALSPRLDAAKANCVIGEQADGYLGIVDPSKVDEEMRRELREVNQQRKAAYERIAAANGVTTEVAAQVTAERLMNGAPPGQCVRDPDGQWIKKP